MCVFQVLVVVARGVFYFFGVDGGGLLGSPVTYRQVRQGRELEGRGEQIKGEWDTYTYTHIRSVLRLEQHLLSLKSEIRHFTQ